MDNKDMPAMPLNLTDVSPTMTAKYCGLTKREYFAALAMQGDMASQDERVGCFPTSIAQEDLVYRAELYVRMADALFEALEK